MVTAVEVKGIGRGLFSKTFGKLFGFFFVFIFLVIPLIYAIIISVEQNDMSVGMSYIGKRFLNPLNDLNEQSLKVIENEGAYPRTGNFFKDFGSFVVTYWVLLGAIYILYRWTWFFAKVWGFSHWSNDSQKFINWSLGIIIVIVLTFGYLALIAENELEMPVKDAWKIPFEANKNLIGAAPYLIKGANSVLDPSIIDGNATDNLSNFTLPPDLINSTNITEILSES